MPVGMYNPASIEVEFWYNSGPGWVLAQSRYYSAASYEDYYDERVTLTIDGMMDGSDFGMDRNLIEGIATFNPKRVEWKESTVVMPPDYDATPAGAAAISFIAIAGSGSGA